MQFGLYLMGGGAKGAFQAGVLCALNQRGVRYGAIAGTSIGAINGWMVYHNAFDELQAMYCQEPTEKVEKISGLTIDPKAFINELDKVKGEENGLIQAFYVNYVRVVEGKLVEKVEDLKGKPKAYALNRISYSATLPYNQEPMSFPEYIAFQKKHNVYQQFKEDLAKHVYDDMNLDGGLVNNLFIQDLMKASYPIIVIAYEGSRQDYLEKLEALHYKETPKIIYISSDHPFKETDALNFDLKFTQKLFNEGYNKGMTIPILAF